VKSWELSFGYVVGDVRVMALLLGGGKGNCDSMQLRCYCRHQISSVINIFFLHKGYAEYCVSDERTVLPSMDLRTAAADPKAFMTAYQLLYFVGNIFLILRLYFSQQNFSGELLQTLLPPSPRSPVTDA
jgi:hypothetical protein